MDYVLDQLVALERGYKIPRAGIFRGERAKIVKDLGDTVQIILPDTNSPNELYTVSKECLSSEHE